MSAARDFRGDYSPGGLTTAAKRRALARRNGRRGGLESGRRRRKLSPGRRQPRRRTRHEALNLAYPHRQLTRSDLFERYELAWPRPERPTAAEAWEKGRTTLWEHYRCVFSAYRIKGQHYVTTNDQRRAALEHRGSPRCRRTIQRLNRKLDVLGVAYVRHYKNQRAQPGKKDFLVVEIGTPTKLHVTLLLRSSGNPPEGREVPTTATSTSTSTTLLAPASRAVPPDGGDQRQAPPAPVTDDGVDEALPSFEELQGRLFEAACRSRAILGLGSPPPRQRGSDARCSGR